jgi:catechol 2,3-dioxygenase-like lactoylglutathione lyase family enzyme
VKGDCSSPNGTGRLIRIAASAEGFVTGHKWCSRTHVSIVDNDGSRESPSLAAAWASGFVLAVGVPYGPRHPLAEQALSRRGNEVIVALDHVQLAMPAGREAEARAFYEGLLGLREVPKPPLLAARGGCWFGRGAVQVHLGVEKDFRPARKAHPAFLVDNVAELRRSLEASGLNVVADEAWPGYERFYVDDPFGNRIEMLQPMSTADAQ